MRVTCGNGWQGQGYVGRPTFPISYNQRSSALRTPLSPGTCHLPGVRGVLRRAALAKVALSKRFTRHRIDAFLRSQLRGVSGTVLDLGAGLRPFAELMP